jgi:predicted AlkP superfamily pyrophosphatase or phosphodiesterase
MVKTIVLMLDAFRRDYITSRNTPFLYGLTRKYGLGQLKQHFGFKNTVGFYTGVHPRKLGLFTNYIYDKKIRAFPYSILLSPFPGKLKFHLINFFNHLQGNDMSYPSINMDYFKYFKLKQKKHFFQQDSIKTIFSVFKRNEIGYLFYDFPFIIENGKSRIHYTFRNNDEARAKKFLKLINKHSFYYIHLTDLDSIGHKFGPKSSEIKRTLRKTDGLVKEILSNFDLEKDNNLIWSDHGMVPINKIFDLQSKLPGFGKDYIYFLESTMARFWFFNKKIKKQVLSILEKHKDKGKILSKQDKKSLKIDFNNNLYGDEIFLLNSGTLLYPNFFNNVPVKGMHGYDLSDRNETTFLIINRKFRKQAKMEDLFPTLLQLMQLKFQSKIDGKSLFRK